jgi:hypothetical protein
MSFPGIPGSLRWPSGGMLALASGRGKMRFVALHDRPARCGRVRPMEGRAAVASARIGCTATTERGPPCSEDGGQDIFGGTRCGRVRPHWMHGHDGAWPSISAHFGRPRQSVALHIGARWAATTERGPRRLGATDDHTARHQTLDCGPADHNHWGAIPRHRRPAQAMLD